MRWIAAILMGLISVSAWAEDSVNVAPAIAKQIRAAIPSLPIQSLRLSPISGLYEAQVGGQIFYVDKTGKYLISGGHIFDTTARKDLTAERLEQINTVDWSSLPLEQAIVSGDEDGMPVAVFTDPDCPYCKKLEQKMIGIKGVKFYTFLFPLRSLHPTAYTKSKAIWCAENQHEALLQVMLGGKSLPEGTCKNPIDANIALGTKLGITGTPTLIAGDGRKYAGVKNAQQLKAWLNHQ